MFKKVLFLISSVGSITFAQNDLNNLIIPAPFQTPVLEPAKPKPKKFYYWGCLEKHCGYQSKKHLTRNSASRYAVAHSQYYQHAVRVYTKRAN